MRLINNVLDNPGRYFFQMVGFFMIFPMLALGITPSHSKAQMSSTTRDCDSNAVIYCGAMNYKELKRKYNNQSDVSNIFLDFGITSYDINHMKSHMHHGKVTKGGRVMVDGKVVATNAMTAGRQNIAGSTPVSNNGTQYYTRSPSLSFVSASLPAFVVMKDGKFDFAIIKSCGNPVSATPVVKKKHVQKTKTVVINNVVPSPAPPPTQTQSQVQSQSITIVKNTPPPQPKTSPPPKQPEALPNTGAGDVAAISTLATIFGTLGHIIYQRKTLT